MKQLFTIIAVLIAMQMTAHSQETGYYNGTDGKTGEELKSSLYDIIKDHKSYDYSLASTVFIESDQDPDNEDNVILVYTGRSHPNDDYGSGGDYINREHVWAKSHGNLDEDPPEGSDFHNLKPADASVNMDKSNLDFDNGGEQHDEATGCYYDSDSWEPRDEVKGDIARIIFYMATRYEGENGEEDLQVVDEVDTYPNPEHGKLSTLLEWNEQDPPDEFERNRNNVIFDWQQNRNPFVDNPNWVNKIWGDGQAEPVIFDDISITNEEINSEDAIEISANIQSTAGDINSASIKWGTSYEDLNNEISMSADGSTYTGVIPVQPEDETVYYKIVASDGTNNDESVTYNYTIPATFDGELVTIYDIQGQQEISPMADQIQDSDGTEELNYGEVSTTGVVTASFGGMFFIQDGEGPWNGIMVYENKFIPQIGDSIVLTGLVKEYYNMTEMVEISGYYHIASDVPLPEPTVISTGGAEEQYEGILVEVIDAECTDDDWQDYNNYDMWSVNDGSGELKIHNSSVYKYNPTEGEIYTVTGPLNYDYGEYKIELRNEDDVTPFQDETAPELISAYPNEETEIKVNFSEEVEKTSAENTANYTIDGEIEVTEAKRRLLEKTQVLLTVTEMTEGESYSLTVSGVKDDSGNTMEETTLEFSYDPDGIAEFIRKGSFRISPNPFDEKTTIRISAKKSSKGKMKVYTTDGRNVQSQIISLKRGANKFTLNTRNMKAGTYFLVLELNGELAFRKMIKK
ncbi:MAG: endonuclease [Bacteroidales bacterium]|nr:endonuclease [Bacteroidales bacterium]MCF8333254.1 endonuclease [Bacteroidales bacterium]